MRGGFVDRAVEEIGGRHPARGTTGLDPIGVRPISGSAGALADPALLDDIESLGGEFLRVGLENQGMGASLSNLSLYNSSGSGGRSIQ